MNTASLHCIVLAAGKGTRMKSALPKVLHPIAGRPMLAHVLEAARALGAVGTHVVYGHGGDAVRAYFDEHDLRFDGLEWVRQSEQLGTAHAVKQAMPKIPNGARVLVLYGDVPLIRPETLRRLIAEAGDGLGLLTVELDDPGGYGRIVRDARFKVKRIVEDKDANARQKAIREVNTGVLTAPASALRAWLERIGNDNAKGEYYLTDVVGLAVDDKQRVAAVTASSAAEVEGVNDRLQLAHQERVFQAAAAERLLRAGLGLADPSRFDLRGELEFGHDVNLDVGVIIEGKVSLGDGVRIGPYCVLRDVEIAAGTQIAAHSLIESARIGRDCRIGPFARIRPDTVLEDEVHIGNFVETKKTQIGRGSKANHLSYLGDAQIGSGVNIGAGTITCNYDGSNKHTTVIENGAFVGSNTSLVAPVRVGSKATVGAGSVLTRDAPDGALTIARSREQKSYTNWQRPSKKK